MKRSRLVLCAAVLGAVAPTALPAHAANDADLAAIRQEMKALRGDYEGKISRAGAAVAASRATREVG